MYAVLSPAKTLDFSPVSLSVKTTKPVLSSHINELVSAMKEKSAADIKKLMGVSDKIAQLNYERYQSFETLDEKAALLAFQGDVYKGLEAETLDSNSLDYAQDHIGILSGLYGLLRPLDMMKAYRLEMGTSLVNERGQNLYEFWGDLVTGEVNKNIKDSQSQALVNLASNEYSKVLNKKRIHVPVIDVAFKEIKGNAKPKIISFYAKKARGTMARFMIDKQVNSLEALRKFDCDGYYFEPSASCETELVFYRHLEG